MKNQAILTLLVDKQEVFKVGPNQLSPRGCEFFCNDSQVDLFRDGADDKTQKRYASFQVRLGLFPHAGPVPQYITALGQVISVRRSAQDCFCVVLHFDKVDAGGIVLLLSIYQIQRSLRSSRYKLRLLKSQFSATNALILTSKE